MLIVFLQVGIWLGLCLSASSGASPTWDSPAAAAAGGHRRGHRRRRARPNSHAGARARAFGAGQPDVFDVAAFGAKADGANADNATDNTKPFQAALDACHTGGGGEVFAGAGVFRFRGSIAIPPGCTLSGTFTVVPSHDLRGAAAAKAPETVLHDGTVLLPTGGRAMAGGCDLDCTAYFINVGPNGVLRGLVIYYGEQETTATPVPYPWAVFLGDPDKKWGGSANNAAVTDVELLGAWNGVAAVAAHRHYIARVQGQPLNIGVFVDETYDIGRIEDVHFNPWFSDAHPFAWYQTTHGRAFVMGRSDWEYVFNTFAFGYAIGYHFIERATGSMNGNFLGIGQDLATNASVQVDQSQPFGVLITNGEFTSFCDDGGFAPPSCANPSQVVVGKQNKGAVKFVNSAFWGPTAQIAQVDGEGTVTFSQCHFDSWDNYIGANGTRVHKGTAAINQHGGTLIVSQSEFTMAPQKTSSPAHVWLGPNAQKTIISENIVKGVLKVENEGKGKTVVVNNVDDSPAAAEL
jgi:hypothetical protein